MGILFQTEPHEQQLLSANANIGAARAAFFPRISLTTSLGTASSRLTGLFNSGSWGLTLAPQLLLPIFDAGRNTAGLASAKAGEGIAIAQYEKSIQTAFREVSDALDNRATLGEQLRAQQAQANAEALRFKLSDLRYQNGIPSQLDVLDAQRDEARRPGETALPQRTAVEDADGQLDDRRAVRVDGDVARAV